MNPIEKYAEEQGYKLAAMIDEKLGIVTKPRPKYCPDWLYKRIIKDSVEMVNVTK